MIPQVMLNSKQVQAVQRVVIRDSFGDQFEDMLSMFSRLSSEKRETLRQACASDPEVLALHDALDNIVEINP